MCCSPLRRRNCYVDFFFLLSVCPECWLKSIACIIITEIVSNTVGRFQNQQKKRKKNTKISREKKITFLHFRHTNIQKHVRYDTISRNFNVLVLFFFLYNHFSSWFYLVNIISFISLHLKNTKRNYAHRSIRPITMRERKKRKESHNLYVVFFSVKIYFICDYSLNW